MKISKSRTAELWNVQRSKICLGYGVSRDKLELRAVKEAHLLFKVIDQRYNDNKSLIFTTNVEEADWTEFLGDPITTSAMPHSVAVRINGPSYRVYQSNLLQTQYAGGEPENPEAG